MQLATSTRHPSRSSGCWSSQSSTSCGFRLSASAVLAWFPPWRRASRRWPKANDSIDWSRRFQFSQLRLSQQRHSSASAVRPICCEKSLREFNKNNPENGKSFPSIYPWDSLLAWARAECFSINQTFSHKTNEGMALAYSPDWRWRRQNLIKAFFPKQPVRIHFALSLYLSRTTRLDDVAAGLLESVARRLRHMDAPWRAAWFHSNGNVKR